MQGGNIKVFARVRPLNEKQLQSDSATCIASLDNHSIKMRQFGNMTSANQTLFTFDRVFGSQAKQQQVFDVLAKDLLDSVFQGINGTVFAYGQTSSGKTFTCMGPDPNNQQLKGLIPRLVADIFRRIQQAPEYIEFRLKLSLVEIYMEKLRDLIDVERTALKIRQSKARGIYIENCSEVYVSNPKEVLNHINTASGNRSLGHTNMNQASSRSHMVLFITIYQNNLQDLSAKSAKLTVIDLAGSEKVGKTGAEGKLLQQAKNINKSLSALGNVINALTQPKISHVPYRDSKLTRILQQSLGGNAKTSLIINLSPSILNDAETLSTLRFGYRAKNIKNNPKVNREYTVAELLLLLEKAEFRIKELERMKGVTERETKRKEVAEVEVGSDQEDNALLNPQKSVGVELGIATSQSPVPSFLPQQLTTVGIDTTEFLLSPPAPQSPISQSLALLQQQLQSLTSKNTELSRNYDIEVERHNALKMDNWYLQARMVALEKENQRFVEEGVKAEMRLAGIMEKVKDGEEKIMAYERREQQMQDQAEKLGKAGEGLGISLKRQRESREDKVSSLFGELPKPKPPQLIEPPSSTSSISELLSHIASLQHELALYQHLKEQKVHFVEERDKFQSQRHRLVHDLQNRIQKVVLLQEMLDQQRQRNACLLRNINLDEKSKTKRIVNLEAYVAEISTSYYVLKNQQASWQADHSINQNKMRRKNERITELETELAQAKESLYLIKIKYEELAQATKSKQGIEVYCRDSEKRQPNIVKVLRSTLTPRVNESMN